MYALAQHIDTQGAADQTAKRGGAPQLLVIAAAGVEADDQVGVADARGQRVDVEGQVGAAALLARLDEDSEIRMGDALLAQRHNGGQCREDGVAVVGAAAAVEPVAVPHGSPRPEVRPPAVHLRLLVQMAVQQHVALPRAGDLDQYDRGPVREPHHLHVHVRVRLAPAPRDHQVDCLVHESMRLPIGVEQR